jgi:hypothetical protein
LTLGRTTFTTVIFFDGPALDEDGAILDGGGMALDGGGTILDGVAKLRLVFTLFVVNFFDTSTFQLSLTA